MQQSRAHVRLLIVAGVALLWATAVFGRLGYLQLYRHRDYLLRAQRQQQRIIEISPKRGAIYDRNMHALAMSIKVDSAFAIPNEIKDKPLAAQLLSGVLGLPADLVESRLDSSQNFVWIERKLTPEKSEAITALNLKGVYTQAENKRFYPKADLASHVLGFVDVDEKGLGGIEYALDSQIRGKSEKIVMMADAHQKWFDGAEARRDRGANVVLTLDEKIQYIVEKELAQAIQETHARAGTVIVENPDSGELLAVANWPTFNPNAAKDSPPDTRVDRAASALYEPGSVFKIVTLSAAIDQGITTPDDVVDCQNGAIYIAGHRIRDHKPFGQLTVAQILQYSSDVGAIKIGLRLGAPKFYDYIEAFGFGQPTGVDLPGESRGKLRRLENWTPVSVGSISMGQEVGVTPLQMITAVTAIANGGLIVRPHVVREERHGNQVTEPQEPLPRRVIKATTAASMRRMLEGVVLGGTGKLAKLDGYTVAGKTGTAQKYDPETGRYSTHDLIASFVGFAPINTPAITVYVQLDSAVGAHEGGQVAAPVFKRVAQQVLAYLEVPRDIPVAAETLRAGRARAAQEKDDTLADASDFEPAQAPMTAAAEDAAPATPASAPVAAATTVEIAEVEGIPAPDLRGKTVREVTEVCLKLGLTPVLVGTGLATEQSAEPGAMIRRGSRITVQFARDAALLSAARGKGK
jgi:cell division protein FtsI (penicillin-binding protein 3)